jgi:hypothetical protein
LVHSRPAASRSVAGTSFEGNCLVCGTHALFECDRLTADGYNDFFSPFSLDSARGYRLGEHAAHSGGWMRFSGKLLTKNRGDQSTNSRSATSTNCMGWSLAAIFVLVTAGNLAIVYRWLVLKRHGSLVPVIGGAVGATATACFLPLRHWWIVPLLVDPGAIPLLFITAIFVARQLFKQLTNSD